MSAPIVCCVTRSYPVPPASARSCWKFLLTLYGVISSRLGESIPSMPVTSPNCDARPGLVRLYAGHDERSCVRAMSRQIMRPNVFDGLFAKRN